MLHKIFLLWQNELFKRLQTITTHFPRRFHKILYGVLQKNQQVFKSESLYFDWLRGKLTLVHRSNFIGMKCSERNRNTVGHFPYRRSISQAKFVDFRLQKLLRFWFWTDFFP
jgi:hypothetical protein